MIELGPDLQIAGRRDVQPGADIAIERQLVDRGGLLERGRAGLAQRHVIITGLFVDGRIGVVDRFDIVGDEVRRTRSARRIDVMPVPGRICAARSGAAEIAEQAVKCTLCAEPAGGAVCVDLGDVRQAVHQLPIGSDDGIAWIHVLDPMRRIEPVAVAALGRDIVVRVVGDDLLPIRIQGRINRELAIGAKPLVEGPAAGQNAGHDRNVVAVGVGELLIDDQRTAGIATGSYALMRKSAAAKAVEIPIVMFRMVIAVLRIAEHE